MKSNKLKTHIVVDNNAVCKQTISMKKEVDKFNTERARAKSTLDNGVQDRFIRVQNIAIDYRTKRSDTFQPGNLYGGPEDSEDTYSKQNEFIYDQSKIDNERHMTTVGLRKTIPQNIQRNIIDRNLKSVEKISQKNNIFIKAQKEKSLDINEGALEVFRNIRPTQSNCEVLKAFNICKSVSKNPKCRVASNEKKVY